MSFCEEVCVTTKTGKEFIIQADDKKFLEIWQICQILNLKKNQIAKIDYQIEENTSGIELVFTRSRSIPPAPPIKVVHVTSRVSPKPKTVSFTTASKPKTVSFTTASKGNVRIHGWVTNKDDKRGVYHLNKGCMNATSRIKIQVAKSEKRRPCSHCCY